MIAAAEQPRPGAGHSMEFGAEVQNLSVMRAGLGVLEDINLTLRAGDIVVLRGDNGAGKTTLLRAIARLLPVSSGSVRCRSGASNNLPADQKTQTVFYGHDNAVKGALTVRENLAFWARRYRSDAHSIDAAAENLALVPLLDRPANQLSAGQRRRVGFCRVLISQKPLWLLDEPTASMDAGAVQSVLDLVMAHATGGGVALIATHEPVAIASARSVWLGAPAQASKS